MKEKNAYAQTQTDTKRKRNYHVMMRGNEKKNLFLGQEDKQRYIETLFLKKAETSFSLYAYCLMDNHVHLLVREGPEGTKE